MSSRVAKNPIIVPAGVDVAFAGNQITVKGSKGSLCREINAAVTVSQENHVLNVAPKSGDEGGVLAGTMRALLANMVSGVVNGFERKLTLIGVGYRAQIQGRLLNLTLGHSHPVTYQLPEGIVIETPSQTEIVIKGVDKQLVGQVAAKIRAFRPPEPYKGKGVRYANEVIELKEGKKK